MKKYYGLILAKNNSNRLPNKNNLDFKGKPMFLENVRKCKKIFGRVFVSSDSKEMLKMAVEEGAYPILRGENLCGETPNIPVYQHALDIMDKEGGVDGIIAVQANSPTIDENVIRRAGALLMLGVPEVMTCHPVDDSEDYHSRSHKIYGSVWALSRDRLINYKDPYKPQPEALIVDNSIDIETLKDYNLAINKHE